MSDANNRAAFERNADPTNSSERTPEKEGGYDSLDAVETYVSRSRIGYMRFVERLFVKSLLKEFGQKNGLKILDIGTGPGWIPIMLAKASPTWKITAVDASHLMLEKARTNAQQKDVEINWVLGRADAVPFPSGEFDLIISHFAFHEFSKPQEVLREIERLLKPGGRFVIQDLQRPNPVARILLGYLGMLVNFSFKMGRQYRDSLRASYRAPELIKYAEAANLQASATIYFRLCGGLIRLTGMKNK